MRRLFLIIGLFITLTNLYGQDPRLGYIWYLYAYENGSGWIHVVNVEPSITPTFTLNEDLSFNGEAACNNYQGLVSIETSTDGLFVEEFQNDGLTCTHASHSQFESDYFTFFEQGNLLLYAIIDDMLLDIAIDPDNVLYYGLEPPLSIPENEASVFVIFPNPVKDRLLVASEGYIIEKLVVNSMTGQQLINIEGHINSLDVSSLAEGIYLLEIHSEGKRQLKKFIKH